MINSNVRQQERIAFPEDASWLPVARLLSRKVARSIAALLEAEQVEACVLADDRSVGAIPAWMVLVCAEQFEAARDLLSQSQPAEQELAYMATGQLDGDDTW